MKYVNSFIADELVNKNKYLTQALDQAKEIIEVLEQENLRLRDVLTNLASINNKDLDQSIEVEDDKFCTV
jgi:small-conductance mechanosensitive channel